MKRLCLITFIAAVSASGCNIYHYSNPIPGENVVFKDEQVVKATAAANSDDTMSSPVGTTVVNDNGGSNEPSYNPGPLTQEINMDNPDAAESDDPNAPPSWIKKQSFEEIERGKQIVYGVGFSYYQAPTSKELGKARTQAEKKAFDALSRQIKRSLNIDVAPEEMEISATWQDNAQMALYCLAKYVHK